MLEVGIFLSQSAADELRLESEETDLTKIIRERLQYLGESVRLRVYQQTKDNDRSDKVWKSAGHIVHEDIREAVLKLGFSYETVQGSLIKLSGKLKEILHHERESNITVAELSDALSTILQSRNYSTRFCCVEGTYPLSSKTWSLYRLPKLEDVKERCVLLGPKAGLQQGPKIPNKTSHIKLFMARLHKMIKNEGDTIITSEKLDELILDALECYEEHYELTQGKSYSGRSHGAQHYEFFRSVRRPKKR